MKEKNFYFLIFISIILYLSSVFLVVLFPDFNFRWISFIFWISAIILIPLYLLKDLTIAERLKNVSLARLAKKEYLLILLVTASIILSFAFLKNYPFVAIGDEVRDGGTNAYQIATGEIKNIYGYGRYDSHGLIIPTVSSFFYKIFTNSVLTYRVPSALIAILSIVTLYLAVRTFLNRRASFFAGLILATSHLHLYYARTEIVIIFTSLLTSAIILTFGIFIKVKSLKYYALMGLVLGFSSGFHASTRTIVFITFFAIFLTELFSLIKEHRRKKQIAGVGLIILFFIIGFGPKILFTTPEIFFHLRTVTAAGDTSGPISIIQGLISNQATVLNNYIGAFRMFIDKPLVSIPFHFQAVDTILPPIISIFVFLGVISAFILRNKFFIFMMLYLLLIPLLNSSLTDCYQCNYRMIPLIVVSAAFAGFGIDQLVRVIKKTIKISNYIVIIFLITTSFFIFYKGYTFFSDNLGSIGKVEEDYLSMHAIYFIKNNPEFKQSDNLCLMVSPYNYKYLNLLHIQEQYQYFIPNKYFYVIKDNKISNNDIYISNDCSALSKNNKFTEFKYCDVKNKFTCPASSVSYSLFVRKNQNISSHLKIDDELMYFVIPPKPLLIP